MPLGFDDTVPYSQMNQLTYGMKFQLLHYSASMGFSGPNTDPQAMSYLLVVLIGG
jgi:hypothetical protein